jgi:hypothetical protein
VRRSQVKQQQRNGHEPVAHDVRESHEIRRAAKGNGKTF